MLTDDQAREFARIAHGVLRTRNVPPDVDRQDVISEALVRAHRQADHDPARIAFAGWVRMHVLSARANLLQHRNRMRRDPDRCLSMDAMEDRASRSGPETPPSPVDRVALARWRRLMS